MSSPTRRRFLEHTASVAGAASLPGLFQALIARRAVASDPPEPLELGPLRPVRDEISLLPLLKLPEGFRYVSYGWTGTQMDDGHRTPPLHDGMAVIAADGNRLTLCRNHELNGSGRPLGDAAHAYDTKAPGGCTNLVFDLSKQRFVRSWASLVGTSRNCAGGPTPWGTWLSCEETVVGPGDPDTHTSGNPTSEFEQTHGWIFEVPAEDVAAAQPLKPMGRFVHEAIAVDPETGIVYETEDRGTAGFYRFLPNEPGKLAAGGKLQMMRVRKAEDLRSGQENGTSWDVEWVDIEDPERQHSPDTTDQLGVFRQGKQQDATTFARLEGCWHADGTIYFISTSGGAAESGQVWQYRPKEEKLTLLFESPDPEVLSMPDNCCAAPHGGLLLCEDTGRTPDRLILLDRNARPVTLAENNVRLEGELGHRGDFRGSEWAGACFSPDQKWLFVNIQSPGITFAITGPWERLLA